MNRMLATLMAALTLSLTPAAFAANTWGTDFSDMWWVPTESGWGANISHQQEVVFMTLYVYGADNRMRWYAATNMQSRGGSEAFTFEGTLYEFAGPYFGAATFNPSNVGVRQVGTASVSFTATGQGSLLYSIDDVVVSKQILRQTFRQNNLTGAYVGSLASIVSGCSSGNGNREASGTSSVSHSAAGEISITTSVDAGGSCTYSGNYFQRGRLGLVSGLVTCTDGSSGNFSITEIEAGYVGFLARYTTRLAGDCSESGTMAWLAR